MDHTPNKPFDKGTHTECIVPGCDRRGHRKKEGAPEVFVKGYCVYHYYRYRTPNLKRTTGELAIIKRHPLYGSWYGMTQRTTNPNNQDYAYYQGRGIEVCERWKELDGFYDFVEDMGPKPSKEYSIDRIDNDGNYEPGNCRWASKYQQMRNTRVTVNRKTGVYYAPEINKWVARIKVNKKNLHLGCFDTEDEAIAKRIETEIKLNLHT